MRTIIAAGLACLASQSLAAPDVSMAEAVIGRCSSIYAMRRLFAIERDLMGNLPSLPDVFPDQMAPIVRVADGERQLEMMRWGMPEPPQFGGALTEAPQRLSSGYCSAFIRRPNAVLTQSIKHAVCLDGQRRYEQSLFAGEGPFGHTIPASTSKMA